MTASKHSDEVSAIVRAVGHTCRGPLVDGVREKVNALLGEGKTVEANALERTSRAGCGYDFNEIILSNDLDGKDHDYKCPKCGVTGSYRAPLIP